MPAEIKKEIQLEIAHVLFMDIVGYSTLLIDEQHALLETLNQIVRGTQQFRIAEEAGKLIKIPTGDGMALIFQDRLEAPVECALEISRTLKEHPKLLLRMGIHSGPVSGVNDVSGRANVAGAGINVAQRVMDCGDAGHILVSKHVAEDLEQYARWKQRLHDLGECEVKHGVRVYVVNLYTEELGNSQPPERFRQLRGKKTLEGLHLHAGTKDFFVELKRRNVYKVAAAYIVAGWALSQGIAQVFPVFDVPNWIIRLIVVLIILGLPIALVLAWMFEITPQGIKRTEDVDLSIARGKEHIWIYVVVIGAAISVGLFFLGRYTAKPGPRQSDMAAVSEKSIAVLPFENLSEDKANAYFATGIQDEILTRLAKIGALRVISRVSTQQYPSRPPNLGEIANQLAVANILEGSVQKAGDQVHINAQLIRAATDEHIWAESYDCKLSEGIFAMEGEVAQKVAEALNAKLTGREEQVIAAKPTDNPEAYDAYLRGLAYSLKPASTAALGAQKYLKEAVRLDPKFALAWALLSYTDSRSYRALNLQPTVALREEARQAAETALTLQPNLGEAVFAKGYYHYSCLLDYDTAVRYFEQARPLLPNNSRIPESLALVERRRGQWERSESYFNEAERLDPRHVGLLTQQAISYCALRRFPESLRKFDQVLNIIPDDVDTITFKAAIAQAEGNLPRAAALLASLRPGADDPNAVEVQVYQGILERNPGLVIPRLKEMLAKPDPALGYFIGELRFWLGWAQEVAGDHAVAQETWKQARRELEPFFKEQPENRALIGDLALTSMGLGDKASAFKLTDKAMAIITVAKDAMDGPAPIEILARVAAGTGERDRAVTALQKLLSIPYSGPLTLNFPLTPALLRLDPMFDPLRGDPRFEKLAHSDGK